MVHEGMLIIMRFLMLVLLHLFILSSTVVFCDKGEPSLNDILSKGPNVLTNLFEILIRWRMYLIAFTGDISKIYHNVRACELEGHLRRFLWRDCQQDRDPDIFFHSVTFHRTAAHTQASPAATLQ